MSCWAKYRPTKPGHRKSDLLYLSDKVDVEKYEFTGPESAPFFEVTTQPIPRDQLTDPKAKGGCLVLVTIKPGLPLGAIRQTIRLDLKLADKPATTMIEIPFEGTIDSDISIIGRSWNADLGRLRIGDVDAPKASCELFRQSADRTPRGIVKPQHVDPAWLKVSLGEPVDVATGTGRDGGVTKIPLTIEIPPGTPPANHLGSDQGKYGELILETTHPTSSNRMYLQSHLQKIARVMLPYGPLGGSHTMGMDPNMTKTLGRPAAAGLAMIACWAVAASVGAMRSRPTSRHSANGGTRRTLRHNGGAADDGHTPSGTVDRRRRAPGRRTPLRRNDQGRKIRA
jgi:hypothetical protein